MKHITLIDPGHGGQFTGAVSHGVQEKDINLSVAFLLQEELARQGVFAPMTRMADHSLCDSLDDDLQERCNIEHIIQPHLTVSIHCNNFSQAGASGFEVFTSPGETASDGFATAIFDSIRRNFPGLALRHDLADGDPDKEAMFKVLTGTKGPAVLVELCFLSNLRDREWILDSQNQSRMAKAIAWAILNRLKVP